MSETTRGAVAVRQPTVLGLRPQSFSELEKLSSWIAASTLVPKDYQNKPENCFVAIQLGMELGLAPMQALQNIAVINGRPVIWGDAMLALCVSSPLCADIHERIEGTANSRVAICVAKRHGRSQPIEGRFSVADAQTAKLWGNTGPWTFYPQRMLQLRARAFCLRDAFPDVLKGLGAVEEQPEWQGETIDGTAEAVPTPPPQSTPPSGSPADQTAKSPPQQAPGAATAGAETTAATNGSKWKASLETALKATATLADLDAMLDQPAFVAWRAKAIGEQATEIDVMIAARRKELTPAPQAAPAGDLELTPECRALLARVASCETTVALDSLSGAPEFTGALVKLGWIEGEHVTDAIKARYAALGA